MPINLIIDLIISIVCVYGCVYSVTPAMRNWGKSVIKLITTKIVLASPIFLTGKIETINLYLPHKLMLLQLPICMECHIKLSSHIVTLYVRNHNQTTIYQTPRFCAPMRLVGTPPLLLPTPDLITSQMQKLRGT